VDSTAFTSNQSGGAGGAVYATGGVALKVTNAIFTSNATLGKGAAGQNTGGAIDTTDVTTVSTSQFNPNTAQDGVAASTSGPSTVPVR
jgi:predicted outer membrane repeat protein